MIDRQGPPLAEAITSSTFQPDLFCAAIAGLCPYPQVPTYTPPFPKPAPPTNQTLPAASGQTVNVLHLSDWHYDLGYLPGSEAQCSKPLCCQGFNSTSSNATTRAASTWGDYNCDQPLKLGEDLLKTLPSVAGPIDFAIFTGDIPSHKVWADGPNTTSIPSLDTSYGLLHKYLDAMNATLYPSIGNHESALPGVNQFTLLSQHNPPIEQYLYDTLGQVWQGWLPADALNNVTTNGDGSYAIKTPRGLKIISVNSNFGYVDDWYLYWSTEQDPNGILQFLINELQDAEDNNERAWIIMHVPPSISDTFHAYAHYYNQIIARYNATIAGQFSGHTHRDEYSSFINPAINDTSLASVNDVIGNIYIGPSVTTYTNLNPGYRIYKIDTGNFEVMDSLTYIADMSKASEWDAQGTTPNWGLEYSARQIYGSAINWPNTTSLNPQFWWTLTDALASNTTDLFDTTYYKFRSKSSGLGGACDATCKNGIICGLRTGRSDQTCGSISEPVTNPFKRDVSLSSSAAGRSGPAQGKYLLNAWRSQETSQHAFVKPEWNKDLCRIHSGFH